jgi:hypothetical protein
MVEGEDSARSKACGLLGSCCVTVVQAVPGSAH